VLSMISPYFFLRKAWVLVNPGESHPEQRGHGSSRESRGERCEDRKGFPRWGKSRVVRTGRDFPAGGNPCLSKGLTSISAYSYKKNMENSRKRIRSFDLILALPGFPDFLRLSNPAQIQGVSGGSGILQSLIWTHPIPSRGRIYLCERQQSGQ